MSEIDIIKEQVDANLSQIEGVNIIELEAALLAPHLLDDKQVIGQYIFNLINSLETEPHIISFFIHIVNFHK